MDHNELARRMGVTTTGSSSHSDKSRMHLKDGGPATKPVEHVYRIGASSKTGGFENLGRAMKGDGGPAFAKITPGDMPRKKLGENGAGRQKALNGGDIKNAAMKAKAGAEDVGRKIKGGFEDFGNKFRNAFHFEEGGEVKGRKSCRKKASIGGNINTGTHFDVPRKKVDGGQKSVPHMSNYVPHMSNGGCAGRKKASIGGDMENVGRKIKGGAEDVGRKIKGGTEEGFKRAKSGAEDVGNKIKGGLEDFGGKFRKAFHFAEGGEASMDMPKLIRKPTKTIQKGEMTSKPTKTIAKGSMVGKAVKPVSKG